LNLKIFIPNVYSFLLTLIYINHSYISLHSKSYIIRSSPIHI
jgi:hypothetical protein